MIDRELGPYRIERELGSGGMGAVYLAVVEGTARGLDRGDRVAVKVLHPHLLAREGFFKRFLREAEIGRAVNHPNVVRTLEVDALVVDGEQHHFLVMEYVDGQTLRSLLEELGRVPEELCRHIGREVASGLGAIHAAGAVHRDLKPENVLITPDHAVRIMDLGVALLADAAVRLSRTGEFVGSLRYAAPEQVGGGERTADARSDLHGLGVLLYELAAGRHPFPARETAGLLAQLTGEVPRPLGDLEPQVSPFLEEVVRTLLVKEPARRFASAGDLVEVLGEGERSSWWETRARSIRNRTQKPLRRIRIPRETAFHSRETELARLGDLFTRAKKGQGQLVLLEGEAGIGKTRLVDEFTARLREDGEDHNFLFGSYAPGGAATAAGAFSTAFRDHLGIEGLEHTLEGYLKGTPGLLPAFAALLRGDERPPESEPLTRDSLQTMFVHTARSLARERPTILLIDDLHFAPPEGRALLAALALAASGTRLLLIGTARPGLPVGWVAEVERLEHVSRLPLTRLGTPEIEALLTEALRSTRLGVDLAEMIAVKSDGNPFFIFEILRDLREAGALERRADGTWTGTSGIRDIEIPSSVRGLIQARISGLGEDDRELLDAAACCGYEFDPLLVGEALSVPAIVLLKRLASVERGHRLVRSAGVRYVFDHHLVQEALYEGLPVLLREGYHLALGEALARRPGAARPDGRGAAELCRHYLAGARADLAEPWLAPALEHLQSDHLHGNAVALADRALAVEGLLTGEARLDLLLKKRAGLELLGRSEEERECLTECLAIAGDLGLEHRTAEVRNSLGWHSYRVGRYEEGAGFLREAMRWAGEAGDVETEARATGNLGLVEHARGRYEEARVLHDRTLDLLEGSGDGRSRAVATGNLGITLHAMGRLDEASELHRRNIELARGIGDRRGEAIATQNLGVIHRSKGRLEAARDLYEQGYALSRSIGDRRGEAIATGNLGDVLEVMGRLAEAGENYDRCLGLCRETGERRREAYALGSRGSIHRACGRFEEAVELHERHLTLARELGDRWGEGLALGNLGMALRDLGRYGESRRRLEQYLSVSRDMGSPRLVGWAAAWLGGMVVQLGDLERARLLLTELADLATEGDMRDLTGEVEADLGRLAFATGDPAAAEDHLTSAVDAHREVGNRISLAETLVERGRIRGETGAEAGARADLDEALAIAGELDLPALELLARAHLTVLPDGDPEQVVAALPIVENSMGLEQRAQARLALWRASGDAAHLEEARRVARELLENAPAECREAMRANVPLLVKTCG